MILAKISLTWMLLLGLTATAGGEEPKSPPLSAAITVGDQLQLFLDDRLIDSQRDVRFEFSTSKAPCRMTDGDDYVYVVAPLSVAE